MGQKLHRFIVYRGDNRRAMAFAADCGMRKPIQGDLSAQSLVSVVQLALNTHSQFDAKVREVLSLVASGDCVFDDEQSKEILSVCRQFENVPLLQLAHARLALWTGNFKQAALITKKILESDPLNTRALGCLGEVLAASGQYLEALKILKTAEDMAAGNPLRIAAIARILAENNDSENAIKCLMRSVQIYPILPAIETLIRKLKLNENERTQLLNYAEASTCSDAVIQDLHKLF